MNPYDLIREQLGKAVPFANHVGVELIEVGDGIGVAALDQRPETSNHIQTQHAGAMFTLGEAASGAALAGAFGPMIFQARPLRPVHVFLTSRSPKDVWKRTPRQNGPAPNWSRNCRK